MKFQTPRGMRDFYPEEIVFRDHLFAVWDKTARLFGFEHYDAPLVEHEDLLKRKAGEEVVEQIYSFNDKSGRRLALRPEITPSLARMIIARQSQMILPAKWFTIAQCFRYERTTRGRKREHFQWNLDIIGHQGIEAELEILAAAAESLKSLGLGPKEVKICVGSRRLLEGLLLDSGFKPEKLEIAFLILDKRGKISDEVIKEMLTKEGISSSDSDLIFKILAIQSMEHLNEEFGQKEISGKEEMETLFKGAAFYGIEEFLQFDISIVRGLAYYSGIVFEAFDCEKQFRALFGGGRYDNLISSLGGKPLSCVGMGFGDVVIKELLSHLGKMPAPGRQIDYCLGYFQPSYSTLATTLAAKFRTEGKKVDLCLKSMKAGKLFSYADRKGAKKVIFIAPDELAGGQVAVRDLETKEQSNLSLKELGIDY